MRHRFDRVLAAAFLVACKTGMSGEVGDAGGLEDGGSDATASGDDAGQTAITVETPADASFPGDVSLPAACASFDAGLPAYGSPAGATVTGSGVSATVCTGTDAYLSSYIAPANRLLLEIDSVGSTTFQSPPGATGGSLTMVVSIGTDLGVYTSAESAACGFVAFTYTQDTAATFKAAAGSNCVDGQNVAGSWEVRLTSITPAASSGSTTQGTYYVAHGQLVATLPEEDDAGAGPLSVSMAF